MSLARLGLLLFMFMFTGYLVITIIVILTKYRNSLINLINSLDDVHRMKFIFGNRQLYFKVLRLARLGLLLFMFMFTGYLVITIIVVFTN